MGFVIPTLETPRLTLRAPRMSDANDIFAYAQDAEFFTYLPAEPHKSIEDTRAFIRSQLDFIAQEQRVIWSVVHRADQKVIGACNIHDIERKHFRCEMGYALARAYWGQGLMTEAARAMLRHAFGTMQAHRVVAMCEPNNIGSERVMQKCGMTYEGTLRDHRFEKGRFVTFKVYGILSSER